MGRAPVRNLQIEWRRAKLANEPRAVDMPVRLQQWSPAKHWDIRRPNRPVASYGYFGGASSKAANRVDRSCGLNRTDRFARRDRLDYRTRLLERRRTRAGVDRTSPEIPKHAYSTLWARSNRTLWYGG